MGTAMIVAGIHLDRAWSHLGSRFGSELRRWSKDVLVRLIDLAGHRDVAALVVAGDLLDRQTVVPETIEYAADILGAFPGSVLIVPGRSDWVGGPGPYDLDLWKPNTTICREAEFQPWDPVPGLLASAWTSPDGAVPRLPGLAADGQTLLRPAACDLARLLPLAARGHLITTAAEPDECFSILPDLVHEPGDPGGFALIFDTATRAAEQVPIPGQPGTVTELDVTGFATAEQFATRLGEATRGSTGPVKLRLTGELAPKVLLPGFGGPDVPSGVVVDLSALQYGQAGVEPDDRSAEAEFIRAMAASGTTDPERHQVIALGLTALDESSAGR